MTINYNEPWRIEEQRQMNEWADGVLRHDAEKLPTPKLRCRLFGHKWLTHVLVLGRGPMGRGPGRRMRTICTRCKVNADLINNRRDHGA